MGHSGSGPQASHLQVRKEQCTSGNESRRIIPDVSENWRGPGPQTWIRMNSTLGAGPEGFVRSN